MGTQVAPGTSELLTDPNIHAPVPNPLTDNRLYVKQGRNRCFEAVPAIVHFGGFSLHQSHTQVLRIKNVSSISRRLHILNPTTPYYKIKTTKLGLVAPGMSEEVTVQFTPDAWRYYYDSIRLHSEDENMAVPCHGYPVANELKIPKSVDFGAVAINELAFRTITLECKTPINFEYEVEVHTAHPDMEVTATRGVVPAMGSAQIELRFRPTAFRTAIMKLTVRLSQFGAEPVTVEVRGNSQPGMLKEAALSQPISLRGSGGAGADEDEADEHALMTQTRESFGRRPSADAGGPVLQDQGSNYFSADHAEQLGFSGGGGGGRRDLYSSQLASRQRLNRSQKLSASGSRAVGNMEVKMPNFRPPPAETVNAGIRFPANLMTHGAINDCLMQEPGKLKIRDLKAAIAKANAKAEADAAKLQGATIDDMAEAADDEEGGGERQLKETVFEREYLAVEAFERSKEVRWFTCIGEDNMTPEERASSESTRAARAARAASKAREKDRRRRKTEALQKRVIFVRNVAPEGEPRWEGTAAETSTPAADGEKARRYGLQRFRDAASMVTLRFRVSRRLGRLRAVLERVGRSKEAVGELVGLWDDQHAMTIAMHGAGADEDDGEHTIRMALPCVQRFAFPVYRDAEFGDRQKVAVLPTVPFFEELDTFTLKAPPEASLMGYRAEESWRGQLPCGPFDFPAQRAQCPADRIGAQEESAFRAPCRAAVDAAGSTAQRALGAADSLELPIRAKTFDAVDAFTTSSPFDQAVPEFALRPGPSIDGGDAQAAAGWIGAESVVASSNVNARHVAKSDMLSNVWGGQLDANAGVIDDVGALAAAPVLLMESDYATDQPGGEDGDEEEAEAAAAGGEAAAEADAEPAEEEEDEFLQAAAAMLATHSPTRAPAPSARDVAAQELCARMAHERAERAAALTKRVAEAEAAPQAATDEA